MNQTFPSHLIDFWVKVDFLYYTLILSKALPKRVFFSLFLPVFSPCPIQRGFFPFLALILTKAIAKSVFLYFCPSSNLISTTKGGLLYFCPYSNQSPVTKCVFLYFALILNQALSQMMFFSLFFPLS